jgi:hypothetical protein
MTPDRIGPPTASPERHRIVSAGIMSSVAHYGPTPMFHELPVLVDFHASIALPEARRVMAAVHGLMRRLGDTGARPDDVPSAVVALEAEYGYTARLVGRTREAMEFSITRQ